MQLNLKPYRMGLLAIGLLLLMGNLTTIQAQSGMFYVATNGNDNNPGTEAQPFRTISRGVSGLRPGYTLLVKAGLYQEDLNNTIPSGDSWERPVTVRAYPGQEVIIMPAQGQGAQRVINFRSNHHIVIDGFILDGTYVKYETVKMSGNVDPNIASPHHIRLINNEIRNAGAGQSSNGQYKAFSSGILATGNADYIEYINNRIHGNGVTDFDHGIYHTSSYSLIEGNIIYNNKGSGIKIGWGQNAVDNVVRSNLIYDNNVAQGADGQKKQGRGIGVYAGTGTLVYNNVIRGAHHTGIDVTYGGDNAQIFNNTVYNMMGVGIEVGFGQESSRTSVNTMVRNNIVIQQFSQPAISNARGINTLIENNLSFGVNTQIVQGAGSGNATISNNLINVNPMFVNMSGYDFALQANSPAIDVGANLGQLPTDFIGNARPQGSGIDLGAFEFASSTAPQQPPPPQPTPAPSEPLPLPVPTEPTIRVEVPGQAVQPGSMVNVSINLYNLQNVYGVQAQCATDPAVLSGTEAGGDAASAFNDANSLFVNQGYTSEGNWLVAVSRIQPAEAFSGSGSAFNLRYQVQNPGTASVDCDLVAVDINGHSIPATVVGAVFNTDGTVSSGPVTPPIVAQPIVSAPIVEATPEVVIDGIGAVNGLLAYQGRSTSEGISVQLLQNDALIAEVVTDDTGAYQFSNLMTGAYLVRASAAQHLPIVRQVQIDSADQVLDLGQATLLAGDIDANTLVDIVDASLIGANFGLESTFFPDADLNADGTINIADLVLVGGNFGQSGGQ